MAQGAAAGAESAKRKFNKFAISMMAGMAAAITAAVLLTFKYVEAEKERDLQGWQVRLSIVADSRLASVNEWLDLNFSYIRDLTQNASLQLYLAEIAASRASGGTGGENDLSVLGGDDNRVDDLAILGLDTPVEGEDAGEDASFEFLRNLLIVTAERSGFKAPPPVGEVAANVERAGVAGLGLLDANLDTVIATPDMPPVTAHLKKAARAALDGNPTVIDMYRGPDNRAAIGFALPVFASQGTGAGAKAIGVAMGVRHVGKDLLDRLKQPGELLETAETIIVRAVPNGVEYITPLLDGAGPMEKRLAIDTPNLAASYALERPGGFGLKRNYAGEDVLVASRAFVSAPWVLMRMITEEEALASTESRLRTILIVAVLIIVGVTITIFAVWSHGASVRASQALADMELAVERFGNLAKFMKVVTNSQPTEIIAVDADAHYTFANEPAAIAAGVEPDDLMGKTMASVMGPARAQAITEINNQVFRTFERERHVLTFNGDAARDEDILVLKTDHIPLRGDRDYPPGVLVVMEDISELTRERRRSESILRQLIDTLVSVVDRRDPFSANHSTRTAQVAREIAQEMGLDETQVKTADIAGSLMNLGKIFVPADILTKTGDLTPEERKMLADTPLVTVELLKGVTFEGPVLKTILHMGEHWDGTGRFGVGGDRILPTSQVLAVANAFVGMCSARAWREAMPFEKACGILMSDTGAKFDRRPVAALVNFLENRNGMEEWAHFRDPPETDKRAADEQTIN